MGERISEVWQLRDDSKFFQPTVEDNYRGFVFSRRLFGPGESGQRSFSVISYAREILQKKHEGETLSESDEAIAQMDSCAFENENGERCGKIPTGTVNYDVLGEEEMKLVCSREHGNGVQKKIEEDLWVEGRDSVVARNGWGRF